MGITTEEFVARFHSVDGVTVGERRKSLFLLLNSIEQSESKEIDFSRLHAGNPLEEKFKVETLLHFRRTPDLVEILKSENAILIERVLKESSWFLQEVFRNVNGEQLVTLLFPSISFNAKAKVLNKLAVHLKDPQQANNFFEFIEQKYGLFLASKLLPALTLDAILHCIQIKKIKPTPAQLLIIIKKFPEATESILSIIKNTKVNIPKEYKSIFLYFAQNDFDLFLKLNEEYNLSFHLGWRLTKKFINKNKQSVIDDPEKHYDFLHNKQIAKSLNGDYKQLYFNMFPKSLKDFENRFYTIFSTLQKLPRKMRDVNLLLTTFEAVYGSQLWDHPNLVSVSLLKMLPPAERQLRIKMEYKPRHKTEEEWMCYFKTEVSIPYLKKAISLTSSVKARANLIRLLVKTCALNEDTVSLAKLCQYMINKHRNDKSSVRRAFLTDLLKRFELENLTDHHWTLIHELLQLFKLDDESFYHDKDYLEAYIHFRLKNGLPVEDQLKEWVKTNRYNLNIIRKEPQYEKQCLLMFAKLIPVVFQKTNKKKKKDEDSECSEAEEDDKEDPLEYYYKLFINALINWNQRHPNNQISLFTYPDAMKAVKNDLIEEKYSYTIRTIILHLLKREGHAEEKSMWLNLYLARSANYINGDVTKWLLKHQTIIAFQHIEIVTRCLMMEAHYQRPDYRFWRYWRNYRHLENFPIVINLCLSALDAEVDYKYERDVNHAVMGLSYMMSANEFNNFISPYIPADLIADAENEQSEKVNSIRASIGKSFRNLLPTSLALDQVLAFCKGDFLKLVCGSLYSVCSNLNEDKLIPFLEVLSRRAVSVRKHTLHLTFGLLDKEQVRGVINKFMKDERNASVRKFMLKIVFNFFIRNPDDYSWGLLKLNANAVNVKDKEALKVLMQVGKIPSQYIVQYITFMWDFLNKLPDPDRKMDSRRCTLISLIGSNIINSFPKQFCHLIITKYFFTSEEGSLMLLQLEVLKFVCKYIIYCNSSTEQEERLKSHFEVVKQFASVMWNKPDLKKKAGNCVTKFLEYFCWEFLNDDRPDTKILIEFAHLWNNVFKPSECFSDSLHLQLTLIYVEKLDLPQIVRKIADLYDSIIKLYGPAILPIFSKKLNFFVDHFLTGSKEIREENHCMLIEAFTEPESPVYHLLLAIVLLNNWQPSYKKIETQYLAITEKLEKNLDPVVQLYLQNHLIGKSL